MKTPDENILAIIREMALYWNIAYAHELKTLLHFKKIIPDLTKKTLTAVMPEDLLRLYHQLRSESTGTDESVHRQFEYVKRVFKYAHAKGYIRQNPCELIRLPKAKRAKINSLSADDIAKIETSTPAVEVLQKVKDYFLFQCYTGLAWCDLQNFNRQSVIVVEGKLYVQGERGKTGTEFFFPLTVKALALAEKYNYNFAFCIQVYNRELKKLQALAEVEKKLTTHVGRRTFGQAMIDDSVPLEVVSLMLGHSSTAMTERYYARVGVYRVVRDMARLAA